MQCEGRLDKSSVDMVVYPSVHLHIYFLLSCSCIPGFVLTFDSTTESLVSFVGLGSQACPLSSYLGLPNLSLAFVCPHQGLRC